MVVDVTWIMEEQSLKMSQDGPSSKDSNQKQTSDLCATNNTNKSESHSVLIDSTCITDKDPDKKDDLEKQNDTEFTTGLASVFANILRKSTVAKNNSVILAKGNTDKDIARKNETKVEDAEESCLKPNLHHQELHAKRRHWEELGRVKPYVLGKEQERKLQRLATRGVVQLFNAVRKHQKAVEDKVEELGSSEFKQERVMKSLNKGNFLDMLKQKSKKSTRKEEHVEHIKTEMNKDPNWNILRDDFMMRANMKDWDKESDQEDELA